MGVDWAASSRSTTSPTGSASRRRRCRSTWRNCGWRGWCALAGKARRCSTGSRTTTCANSSWTRCTTPSTPPAGSRPTTSVTARFGCCARGSALMGLGHSHDHHHHDLDREDSSEGIRAVKISLVVLGLTAAIQLRHRRGVRLGRPVGGHRAQRVRRADRGPAVDRVRTEPPRSLPALHLRPGSRRGPRRAVRRRDDRPVGGGGGRRGDPPAHRSGAAGASGLGGGGRGGRVRRQRGGGGLPHPGGQTDRVSGAAGRRPARPCRRVDVAGGGGRGGRGGVWASRLPTRSSACSSRPPSRW